MSARRSTQKPWNSRRAWFYFFCGFSVFCVVCGVQAARPSTQAAATSVASSTSPERALLDQYCVTCHNQRAKTANLTLDTMDLAQL